MANNDLTCVSNWSNTGKKTCYEDLGYTARIVICPEDGYIDTVANAKLIANWTTKINADSSDRFYPLQLFFNIEPGSEETIYVDGVGGQKLKVREGTRSIRGMIKLPVCMHQAYRTHNTRSLKAYEVTSTGYIKGTSSDGTKFEPFSLSLFEVEKMTDGGNDAIAMTPVYYILNDPTEWDDSGVAIMPTDFSALTGLDGLQDVTLTLSNTSATAGTLTVATTCDLLPVIGLVAGDFTLADDSGGAEVINGVTDNGDGTYTFDWSTLGADDYILTMDDPADATTKGYEATSTATFTVT